MLDKSLNNKSVKYSTFPPLKIIKTLTFRNNLRCYWRRTRTGSLRCTVRQHGSRFPRFHIVGLSTSLPPKNNKVKKYILHIFTEIRMKIHKTSNAKRSVQIRMVSAIAIKIKWNKYPTYQFWSQKKLNRKKAIEQTFIHFSN